MKKYKSAIKVVCAQNARAVVVEVNFFIQSVRKITTSTHSLRAVGMM